MSTSFTIVALLSLRALDVHGGEAPVFGGLLI
jgi:hypothetical protein